MVLHKRNKAAGPKSIAVAGLFVLLAGCAVTPEPADTGELDDRGQADREQLADAQRPIEHPLRPSEAVARALLNNRERRVRAMQAALKNRQLEAAEYDMLPSLTARAGYNERSEFAASASVPFSNGEPQSTGGGQTFSVSQEKERSTYGVDFTWSILDFGLSYVRAGQKADQYLIAQEEERKAIQNLAQDVRAAYWKAVSAGRLLAKVGPLMEDVNAALERSRQIERERLSDPMNALSYQRSLLDIKRSLGSLREELIGASKRLARLMGMPPSTDIPLPSYDNRDLDAPNLPIDLPTMERTAFMLRPEILTSHYRERISRKQVRVAFLKMFPDLSLNAGYAYDDNRFLRFNEWSSAGAEVSWDLLQVFKANREKRAAETGVELAKERRLATSVAVLTQVHLSVLQFEHSRRKLETARNYLDVSRGIADLVERQKESDSGGRLQVIKERLNSLVAELRRDLAYAQVQNNFARIFKSMGLDPYPRQASTPARLAAALENRRAAWEDGHIGVVARPIARQEPALAARTDAEPVFRFAEDTFSLEGDVTYTATRANGDPLPAWLSFDPASRTFTGRPPADTESVAIRVRAENGTGVYARDRFVLRTGETS
ncbi:MAG: TolC family protein [Halofilum sp. (in: g-proteobacteria)]